jgi:hypothetical protein
MIIEFGYVVKRLPLKYAGRGTSLHPGDSRMAIIRGRR